MKQKSFFPTKNYSIDSNEHISRLGPRGTRWRRYPYETPYFSGYNFPPMITVEREIPQVNNIIIKKKTINPLWILVGFLIILILLKK